MSSLRVLLVDDSPADLEINIRALNSLGRPVETESVASELAFREKLVRFAPDIILSDFSMPGFSGQFALEIASEVAPDVPFIFVSGTIGEEAAIEAMQRGACDYVLKDNLRRLIPAIERALLTAEQKREQHRIESALRDSEERFRDLVETTEDWIWERNRAGKHVYSNSGVIKILGLEPGALIGKDAAEFLVDEDRKHFQAALADTLLHRRGWNNWVLRWRHNDGSVRLLESTAQPVLNEAGILMGYRGIDRDVTLRMQQTRKIQQQARMQALLVEHGNAVLRASDARELLDVTCRVAVEVGRFKAAVLGRRMPDNTLVVVSSFGNRQVIEMITAMGPIQLDGDEPSERIAVEAMRRGRRVIVSDYAHCDLSASVREEKAKLGVAAQIALPIGNPPWGVLGLFSETPQDFDGEETALLERLTAEVDYAHDLIAKNARLNFLAYHHPVTGLPNRARFRELIGPRLALGQHILGMVEVDRFRYFSSSRGHSFSDHLLSAVGARLASLMPTDTLFTHPIDDAFVFAFAWPEGMDAAVARVESLLRECSESPFLIDGEEIGVRLHASVLFAPDQADTAESIERGLVAVLDEAQKRDEPVMAFTEDVSQRPSQRTELERDLRAALVTGGFELFLQPKFDAALHHLTGAEALLRWRHPERGLISPAQFIPALEDTGMIIDVGAWVRREGLSIWRRWQKQGRGDLRMAVNVSARELRNANFLERCSILLQADNGKHGLDIEITESMVMDDIGKCIQVLQSLRGLGCKIHIDDFGTGYSSLSYLSRLPVDTLKIDQSFTAALAISPDTLSLVTNVISLAHSLRLNVVAEGVEDEEQAKLLRLLRCNELQGYHLGRPMPVAEFETRLLP